MTAATEHGHDAGRTSGGRVLARAWTSVALIPVFFLLGFALAELLYAAFGYKPENDDAPLQVDLVTSMTALGVALLPCAGAVVLGRRASRAGERSAVAPMTIGAIAGTALVILTVLST